MKEGMSPLWEEIQLWSWQELLSVVCSFTALILANPIRW